MSIIMGPVENKGNPLIFKLKVTTQITSTGAEGRRPAGSLLVPSGMAKWPTLTRIKFSEF